ncbi:TetR/AcrR family transcriptional regulator [Niameybacter massiliensis]|uniref:TetR/AcrR family transcriptional regulator n=1 Tax=Niameybacter massiliensis TaxID=1658108 RepID=UPI0006B5D062|nr:TetR/AcrR family transcriptional regulator [Niameybacter massiliensis]
MPKVYSPQKREEIRERLIQEALILIKQHGMQRMSIEALTSRVGIAKGTFYSFYKSKESLIYHIVKCYHDKINMRIKLVREEKGYLDRDDIRNYYYSMMFVDDDNIYNYLRQDDFVSLSINLPEEYRTRRDVIRERIQENLKYIKGKKEQYDLDAVINWSQIINITLGNRKLLAEEGLDKIINQLIENMLDELFEV